MCQAEVSPRSRACARNETRVSRGRALAALALAGCLVATGCVHRGAKAPLGSGAPEGRTSAPEGSPATPEATPTRLPSVDGTGVSSAVRAELIDLLSHSVADLSTRSGPSDPRYFQGGVWVSGQDDCFRCNVGPGLAAAALAGVSGDQHAFTLAIQTFDHAIATHRQPDGSFGPPAPGEGGPSIQSMMFANELGTALVVLRSRLDAARIRTWTMALTGAADYLIHNRDLSFYANGNIALGNAVVMALAYRVSGQATYRAAYEQALSFALEPDQKRWAGYGLTYSTTPTRPDGANGAGYLGESAGGAPGFDPEYTVLQADVATRLFWVTRDPRALRLMNLFMNQLLPRIDTTAWTLDASRGSRHPEANRSVGFNSPVLAVLAWKGGRSDLAPLVSSQIATIVRSFRGALTYSNPGMYFDFGSELASLVLAIWGVA